MAIYPLIGLLLLCCAVSTAQAQPRAARVRVDLRERQGPLEIDRFALGQGGLSEEPMWADRAPEIRALRPRLIRLFIQEYFDLLPERGRYHFDALDESVNLILRTGAKPLMCICFKPRALFPKIDQDVVEPESYEEWEKLITALVRHYKQRGAGIRYWEVANEPDIGEDGGCPYRFQPNTYARYYEHTVRAILRADPGARVGGPALAYWGSPILPALLEHCEAARLPLHFVSWHIYSSDPQAIRGTIEGVKGLLKKHPGLQPETILDEWNMNLGQPPSTPRFQPCYVAEVAYQMKEAGLTYSCYYHIRDYHVDPGRFARFMSPHGTVFMARWWNRMPQFDGLFDYQNTVRPAYFLFKLLSRLTGDRLALTSDDPAVHGLVAHDPEVGLTNLLLWNFSDKPARVEVELAGLAGKATLSRIALDAETPSSEENARLRPLPALELGAENSRSALDLEPYGVVFWSLEPMG